MFAYANSKRIKPLLIVVRNDNEFEVLFVVGVDEPWRVLVPA